jgi:hypothetical protein
LLKTSISVVWTTESKLWHHSFDRPVVAEDDIEVLVADSGGESGDVADIAWQKCGKFGGRSFEAGGGQ